MVAELIFDIEIIILQGISLIKTGASSVYTNNTKLHYIWLMSKKSRYIFIKHYELEYELQIETNPQFWTL